MNIYILNVIASEIGKKRRYLAFNLIGTIIACDEHTYTSIEIEFHDITKHKPIKFTDRTNISLGSLGNLPLFIYINLIIN